MMSIDIILVDDFSFQVFCYIDSMSCNQVDVLWYIVQYMNWVGVEDLYYFKVSLFCMVSIIKDF